MRIFTKKFFLFMALIPWISGVSQYDINAIGTAQTIDFTGFDGSGLDPIPAVGQLNSNEWEITGFSDGDLVFGGTNASGDYARGSSTGGVSTGGLYSFDNGTGASLGFQASGSDFSPGSFTLAISNNTGGVINDVELSYEVWVFNDQDRSSSLNFEHSSDNTTYTQEASLDFASVETADGSPAWTSETKSITLSGVNLADGATYYLKWTSDDVSGGGSRDEMAIDNIELTGVSATTPTISASPNSLTGFQQFVGNLSTEQTFDVTGSNLTSDITLNVTAGDYEISETSGAGFGTSITLSETAGEVASTTIYVRLNGAVAASPSNGTITLTATSATDVEVLLEGEILNPDPVVFVDPSTLNGFSHFVGTPSAEQTFEASGEFLTDDITITASGEYEVSLSSGTGFSQSVTLSPSTGTVPGTDVYVRLNGAAANYNQVGDITLTSTGATDEVVSLEGETLDYTLYPIGEVTTNDADGVVDSLDVYVEVRGIVHCIDFDGNEGYSFTIIDSEGDGVNIFNFNDVDGYVVTEGDSIGVKGQVDQFNGLTQIFAEEIQLFTQGNATEMPLVVTELDETTESQLVTLEGLTLVNGETAWPSNGNIEVTDGTSNFTVRVTSGSPLAGTATPSGAFDMIGLGGQYDTSNPYDEGYQLFPCSVTALCNVDVTTTLTDETINANASGLSYAWIDCDNNNILIPGETGQSFTATETGNYAVIITDGSCIDTSDCVEVTVVCNVDVSTSVDEITITATATGVDYQWIDCNDNFVPIAGETSQDFTASENGSYAVIITDGLCSDTSDCVEITTVGLSTEDLYDMIDLYPNPVSNEMHIDATGTVILSIEVFNATGQSVYANSLNVSNTTVSTSNWDSGVYFVNVKTLDGSTILKVIK